jgi:hypothetical protein
MKFSEAYDISLEPNDDWFDPILTVDTYLFIDPTLLYKSTHEYFPQVYKKLLAYFNHIFELVKRSKNDEKSASHREAVKLVSLGESSGLCLGYTWGGILGSGVGKILAKKLLYSMWVSYDKKGLHRIEFIEQIPFSKTKIGPDRLSDTIANIICPSLINYTQNVCNKHNIHMQTHKFKYGVFNKKTHEWSPAKVKIPINPFNNRPILLIPKEFIQQKSIITNRDYWRFRSDNQVSNKDFDFTDTEKSDNNQTIYKLIQDHPIKYRDFIKAVLEQKKNPYDFDLDPMNIEKGYSATEEFIENNSSKHTVQFWEDLLPFLNNGVRLFKQYIEDEEGWQRLWESENNPCLEHSAQNLFYGFLKHYCLQKNVTFLPEYETGRRPLLFNTDTMGSLRFWIRVRLAQHLLTGRNPKQKLIKEANNYDYENGIYLVVLLTDYEKNQMDNLRNIWTEAKHEFNTGIDLLFIDAHYRS